MAENEGKGWTSYNATWSMAGGTAWHINKVDAGGRAAGSILNRGRFTSILGWGRAQSTKVAVSYFPHVEINVNCHLFTGFYRRTS